MNVEQAMAQVAEWEVTNNTPTCTHAAIVLAAEVDRLNAEVARVVQDYEDQTYILNNLNEALADAFPALAEHIDHHPAAHLRVVTADTATPCEPPQ